MAVHTPERHPAWTRAYYRSISESAEHNFQVIDARERRQAIRLSDTGRTSPVQWNGVLISAEEMVEAAEEAAEDHLAVYLHALDIARKPFEIQRTNRIEVGRKRYLALFFARLTMYVQSPNQPSHLLWATALLNTCEHLYGGTTEETIDARRHMNILVERCPHEISGHVSSKDLACIEAELDESDGCLSRFQ
jgi:hypothetical protein